VDLNLGSVIERKGLHGMARYCICSPGLHGVVGLKGGHGWP
jgi:hypothetical protein